jgi:hypothetical protein
MQRAGHPSEGGRALLGGDYALPQRETLRLGHIVADHGGTLTAHSNGPGTGTTFRITLPSMT